MERKINQYTPEGVFMKSWESIKEIEIFYDRKNFPYFRMGLKECLKDPAKRFDGCIWQYADDSKVIAKKGSIFF